MAIITIKVIIPGKANDIPDGMLPSKEFHSGLENLLKDEFGGTCEVWIDEVTD